MAFETLSNDDISNAINELITCLGVKEEEPFQSFFSLLQKKDTAGCVQAIAFRLGLPIRINLTYVPKDFNPGNEERFRTSTMSRTDRTGRGTDSITAQVSIPHNLPMFGMPALQDYPIHVRVSEDCHLFPETFVAIMAHELSHALLASLSHPMKDSELHTDLVPILMGFGDVVRIGRKTVQSSTTGSGTTTWTTTYGYLTDSQFDFAYRQIAGIVERYQLEKKNLLVAGEQLQRKLKTASRSLAVFRDYFVYLDRHPPKKMKQEHAQRIVLLHAQDYCSEWEGRITAARESIEAAEEFAVSAKHYTNSAAERLEGHTKTLEVATDQLKEVTEAISKNARILGRYVGVTYKFKRAIAGYCSPS